MIFWLLFGIVFPVVVAWIWVPLNRWLEWRFNHRLYTHRSFVKDWFVTAIFQAIIAEFMIRSSWHHYLMMGHLISAVIAAVVWWFRSKKRRSAELIGAKSRALRDALVENMHGRRIQVDHP